MKNILLIISLLTVSLYADLSVKQIENMVTKIHEKRVGFDLETLEMTKNPFIITLEEEEGRASYIGSTEGKNKRKYIFTCNYGWKSVY